MVPSLDPGRLLLEIRCASESCEGARAHYELLVTEAIRKSSNRDCLAVDFEGDTLELQVEKVSDGLL